MITNHSYDFFINLQKVLANVKKSEEAVDILNSLTNVNLDDFEDEFRKTADKYPEALLLLPSILAIRDKTVLIMDINKDTTEEIDFDDVKDIEKIVNFSKKSGIFDLFSQISDLKSYLLGVEVGLDVNARKNRSGHAFEKIISNFLDNALEKYPNLSYKAEYTIKLERNKRFDFVIFENETPKIVFECNFYSASGSKPIEVAHAYVDLQKQIQESDMKFVWITDGPGWKSMFSTLKNVSQEIDYILNYRMLSWTFDNIINKVL